MICDSRKIIICILDILLPRGPHDRVLDQLDRGLEQSGDDQCLMLVRGPALSLSTISRIFTKNILQLRCTRCAVTFDSVADYRVHITIWHDTSVKGNPQV